MRRTLHPLRRSAPLAAICLLAACAPGTPLGDLFARDRATVRSATPETPRPTARPVAGPGAGAGPARTAEGFDTSTPSERRAAVAPAAGGALLGTTIASLGAPQEQGFWLRTGLTDRERPGRVVLPETGVSVQVTLRPSGGDPGAGSQLSLAAFRLLGVPLTALPRIEVRSDG